MVVNRCRLYLAKLPVGRRQRIVEPLSKLAAVPDQQLGVGWDGLDGVEEDAELHLAGHQVLLLQ